LLAGHNQNAHEVAVDPANCAVRWTSADLGCDVLGIVALPSLGITVINTNQSLFAHRLSDGVRVGSLAVAGVNWFLAADDSTGAVYGAVESGERYGVHAWAFTADGAGIRITSNGPVSAAGTRDSFRLLAVVPPVPGKRVSHLVVGTNMSSELLVLSLSDLSLVHTLRLEGIDAAGLAADPWGGALAVHDNSSQYLHVLAWPLPGMPRLK